MSKQITISSVVSKVLRGETFKPDEDGFYDVILSTLDVYNSAGEYYPFTEPVQNILKQSGKLMLLAKRNQLFAELDHPDTTNCTSDLCIVNKFTNVNPANVCSLITDIRISKSKTINSQTGRPYVVVRGKIKPMAPHGDIVKSHLETPESNAGWSLRGKFNRSFQGSTLVKTLTEIYTWDFVLAQGMPQSNKLGNLTLESHDKLVIDSDKAEKMIKEFDNSNIDFTKESNGDSMLSIRDDLTQCVGVDCLIDKWGRN